MTLNKGRILRFLLLPALAGLIASGMAYVVLEPAGGAQKPEQMVPVVMAQKAIPARTKLTEADLTIRPVPAAYAWRGALRSPDQAVGKVTAAPLAEGEPVLASVLADDADKSALAFHVPTGLRAYTVTVGEQTGVAGRVQVGDRVDVVAVLPRDVAGAHKSLLLAENLAVLALGLDGGSGGRSAGLGSGAGGNSGYRSITLAVKPEVALRLALAAEHGRLVLMLRPAPEEPLRGALGVSEAAFR